MGSAVNQAVVGPGSGVRRKRGVRVLAVWLLVGVIAAAGSAAWASGFAVSNTEITGGSDSEPVLASAASTTAAPQLVGQGPAPLSIGFTGAWASIDDPAYLFDIDLSETDPSHRYQVGVYSTADLDDRGWTDLQLRMVLAAGPCDEADLAAPIASENLNLLASADAGWVVELDGGSTACVGVPAAGRASDADGTFARRANAASLPAAPSFTASANRIE